ncbi:MAG: hypothetical protein HOG49_21540 [Candidatus Scalindua sp.]|jgi:hypothetical protein|nr:hypothetical protein [Candidatus Scalindua sp.]
MGERDEARQHRELLESLMYKIGKQTDDAKEDIKWKTNQENKTEQMEKKMSRVNELIFGDSEFPGLKTTSVLLENDMKSIKRLLWLVLGSVITGGVTVLFALWTK